MFLQVVKLFPIEKFIFLELRLVYYLLCLLSECCYHVITIFYLEPFGIIDVTNALLIIPNTYLN